MHSRYTEGSFANNSHNLGTRHQSLLVLGASDFVPCGAVVVFPVAAVEEGMVHDFAGGGAVREGVVGDAAGDGGAFREVADVLPAEGDAGLGRRGICLPVVVNRLGEPGGERSGCRGRDAEDVAGIALDGLAGEADAGEVLGGGEDDAAVGVVLGVGFVLAHDGELDAVDGQELVEGQAEGHGGEDVDLDEGLAAGVVGAEGVLPSPFGGEGGEVVRQAGILPGPSVDAECGDGARGFGHGGSPVGRGRVPAGWLVRSDAALRTTSRGRVAGDVGAIGRFVHDGNPHITASGRPVGGGYGAGGRFARGGRASRAMNRRLVGDDDGVSGPCRAGDGGTSGIGRSFPQ